MRNSIGINNVRTEIAILQEPVDSKNPGKGKFKIPTLIINESNNSISKSSFNGSFNMKMTNSIELLIPTEYTYFYKDPVVPAGTKFIVVFVSGNINDIQIIGRYLEEVE